MTVSPPPGPPNRLGQPAKLRPGAVRVVALGGISEVGRNMTVFEVQPEQGAARLLVVDCGMLLGKTNAPGIDITLPAGITATWNGDAFTGHTDALVRGVNELVLHGKPGTPVPGLVISARP